MNDLYADLTKFRLCKKQVWPEKHIFQGVQLQIDFDPDEPSNVKWENLDVKPLEAFLRGIVVFLVLFSVITVMVFFLILNKQFQQTPSATCRLVYFEQKNLVSIQRGKDNMKFCFCNYMREKYPEQDEIPPKDTDFPELWTFCNIW